MALSEQDVFVLSERTLSTVIDQIHDQQWDQTTPDWFQTGRQGKFTLRDIINYHAYDSAWVPDVLAGKTLAEVGSTYDGDLLGNDPKGSYRRYSERAICRCPRPEGPRGGGSPFLRGFSRPRVFQAYHELPWVPSLRPCQMDRHRHDAATRASAGSLGRNSPRN